MKKAVSLIIICASLCLLAADSASAVQYAVLGRLTPDGLVKKTGNSVTVIFTVENQTDKFWVPASVTPQFHYEIFDAVTGKQVRSGDLIYTKEQYVGPNNSVVFGIATISLLYIPAGHYRILLFSSEFKNISNLDRVYLGGATAIRVTP